MRDNEEDILDNSVLNKIIHTQSILGSAHFDFEEFMKLVVNLIQSLTPATGAVVELVEGKNMVYRAVSGTVSEHLGLSLPIEGSISGLCICSNQILSSDDTELDLRVNIDACRKVHARSLVVTPLVHDGKPIGVLKILSRHAHSFKKIHIKTLQIMAGFIASGLANQRYHQSREYLLRERDAVIVELKQTQEYLNKLAHYDFLTGLANRSFFSKDLENILKNKTYDCLALMYLDIDHFKSVNDTYGHDVGDALLKAFAGRLKQCIRKQDLSVRLGGDEFILLLKGIHERKTILAIAEKIIQKMQGTFSLERLLLNITTSIGIAFWEGEEMLPAEFIKKADAGLYKAKEAGRNTFMVA